MLPPVSLPISKAHIAAVTAERAHNSVSLSLEQREQEREASRARELALRNERRAASGLEPVESLDDLDSFAIMNAPTICCARGNVVVSASTIAGIAGRLISIVTAAVAVRRPRVIMKLLRCSRSVFKGR